MGDCFFSRHSNNQDYINARNCYKRSIVIGDNDIYKNLGDIYFLGLGTKKDYKKALKYYIKINKSFLSANPFILENIADIYFYLANENSSSYYYQEALDNYTNCFSKTMELRPTSCKNLSAIYSKKNPQELNKEIEFYNLAIEAESTTALEIVGNIYYDILKNTTESIKYYEKLINKSNKNSDYVHIIDKIGDYYFYETRDYQKAIKYYKIGSDNNSYESKLQLGAMYISGIGTKKDIDKGLKYYNEALLQNELEVRHRLEVCYRLGDIYYDGIIVKRDLEYARNLYKKAYIYKKEQKINDDDSDLRKANDCYFAKNYIKARKFYEKSSEQGNVKAQKSLAVF